MFDSLSWLLILPTLLVIVVVHELGHFFAAKMFGITVLEFGVGFPPRLFGVRYKGTLFSFNALPLGGFVRMRNEPGSADPTDFTNQPIWKRIVVLCAGVAVNIALAAIILVAIFMLPSRTPLYTITVSGVAPGSPAESAGVRAGDELVAVAGTQTRNHAELAELMDANVGKRTEIAIRRGAAVSGLGGSPEYRATEIVVVTPRESPPRLEVVETVSDPAKEVSLRDARRYDARLDIGDEMTQGGIGVMLSLTPIGFSEEKERQTLTEAVPNAFRGIGNAVSLMAGGIWRLITGSANEGEGLVGPVGIAQITGQAAQLGWFTFFQFVALLNLVVGIMNILPIPALDGGQVVFRIIEWARGKPVRPVIEMAVNATGFGLMILGTLLITFFELRDLLFR